MSLASSPDCVFRSEGTEFKTLFPSAEDSTDAFDEYLNGDIYEHSDQGSDEELSEALTEFLERKRSIDSRSGFSPVVAPARQLETSPQPWRKGLWCINQNLAAAPDIRITKTRDNYQERKLSLKRTYDDTGKQIFLNPRTPPATIASRGTKNFVASPKKTNPSSSTYARYQPSSREATLSPSPMHAQLQHKVKLTQQDSWQKDFQDFHLKPPEDVRLSFPLIVSGTQEQRHTVELDAAVTAHNRATRMQHGYQNMYAVSDQPQNPQHGYSALNPALLCSPEIGLAISTQLNEAIYTSQYQEKPNHILPTWTTDGLESSDESHHSYNSLQSLENAQLVEAYSLESPLLPGNNISEKHQYAQQYYYPIISQPTPHRPIHQLVQNAPALHAEGLGIQFSPPAALSPPIANINMTNPMQGYPPLPPPPTYTFTNEDPFSTPRHTRRQSSPSRSPSPCISPTNTTRTIRQRSPTHHASPTRNRRKSIGNVGPIIHTSAPPMPKTPKTPRTPRTPTGNCVIDFVNFTPKDSAKLLSDVAPSGSSKTRARREAEAKEKRKRLSEAAVKAVRKAGGDMRVLKREGICLS